MSHMYSRWIGRPKLRHNSVWVVCTLHTCQVQLFTWAISMFVVKCSAIVMSKCTFDLFFHAFDSWSRFHRNMSPSPKMDNVELWPWRELTTNEWQNDWRKGVSSALDTVSNFAHFMDTSRDECVSVCLFVGIVCVINIPFEASGNARYRSGVYSIYRAPRISVVFFLVQLAVGDRIRVIAIAWICVRARNPDELYQHFEYVQLYWMLNTFSSIVINQIIALLVRVGGHH